MEKDMTWLALLISDKMSNTQSHTRRHWLHWALSGVLHAANENTSSSIRSVLECMHRNIFPNCMQSAQHEIGEVVDVDFDPKTKLGLIS